MYVGNNPLMFVGPTGLLSTEHWNEIRDELYYRGGDYLDLFDKYCEIEREEINDTLYFLRSEWENKNLYPENFGAEELLLEIEVDVMNMIKDYNKDIIPRQVQDYGGGTPTGAFEDDYIAYKQDPHPGIDYVNSDGFQSPFYSMLILAIPKEGTSNQMVFSIIGTTMNMRLKHTDTEDVLSLKEQATSSFLGGLFSPGEIIVPYPERGNPSFMRPHFPLEMNKIVNGVNKLINPIGLGVGTVDKYLFNYGTLEKPNWGGMNENFGR